jgi:hypothetical protein
MFDGTESEAGAFHELMGMAGEHYLGNAMAFGSSDHSFNPVAHHLTALSAKVDEIAERAGVSAVARLDLAATLAALPWPDRRRLGLILESARVGTTSAAVREAVAVMLALAAEIWARTPPPAGRGNGEEGP